MKYRRTIIGLLLLVIGLAGGCKTQESAGGSAASDLDYRKYQSYQFGQPVLFSSKDPVFSWNQFEERVKREINFILPSKGLEPTRTDPGLLVYYYALVDPDKKPAILDYTIGWAAEPFIEKGEQFSRYPNNTFVIDLVDTDTRQLVWRASTSLPFDDPDDLYGQLSRQLRELFESYPNVPERP